MSGIIIIENQKTQFAALREGLCNNDIVCKEDLYPHKDNDWKLFMNWVKIAINQDYGYVDSGEYRRDAKNKLYDIIITKEPSILIIDYLLGGTTCEKGVELAQDIIDNVKNPQFSIIFLSRERPTSDYDDFREKYKNNIHIDWLSKSYSQDKVLEANYIKNKLCKQIKEVLEKHSQREDPEVVNVLNSFLEEEIAWVDTKYLRNKFDSFINMRRVATEEKYGILDNDIITIISNRERGDWKKEMQKLLQKMDKLVKQYKKEHKKKS